MKVRNVAWNNPDDDTIKSVKSQKSNQTERSITNGTKGSWL